jgi:hypothetical protein
MRRTLPLFVSALLLAVLFGCDNGSGPAAPGLPSLQGPDLNDEYGGYSFTSELPAFGEPELFAQDVLAGDTPFEDEFENDPGVDEIVRRPNCDTYMLRIEWGRLVRLPDEETQACRDFSVDWSGRLALEHGAILLKRVIQFERDDEIHKRTDRRLLEWTSHTGRDFDGILVRIVDAPAGPPDSARSTEPRVANQLTIRTGPYSRTFTLDELEHIDEMIPVDRCGNYISFEGFRVEHDPCPHGFLAGVWEPVSTDSVPPDSTFAAGAAEDGREIRGYFYGNWIQANGMLAGNLRGVYGVNSAGRQVFFGKYIDLSGNFKGILRGTYGSMSMGPFADTAGYFQGEWIDENKTARGLVNGRWIAPLNTPRGFFHGRWGTRCSRGEGGS